MNKLILLIVFSSLAIVSFADSGGALLFGRPSLDLPVYHKTVQSQPEQAKRYIKRLLVDAPYLWLDRIAKLTRMLGLIWPIDLAPVIDKSDTSTHNKNQAPLSKSEKLSMNQLRFQEPKSNGPKIKSTDIVTRYSKVKVIKSKKLENGNILNMVSFCDKNGEEISRGLLFSAQEIPDRFTALGEHAKSAETLSALDPLEFIENPPEEVRCLNCRGPDQDQCSENADESTIDLERVLIKPRGCEHYICLACFPECANANRLVRDGDVSGESPEHWRFACCNRGGGKQPPCVAPYHIACLFLTKMDREQLLRLDSQLWTKGSLTARQLYTGVPICLCPYCQEANPVPFTGIEMPGFNCRNCAMILCGICKEAYELCSHNNPERGLFRFIRNCMVPIRFVRRTGCVVIQRTDSNKREIVSFLDYLCREGIEFVIKAKILPALLEKIPELKTVISESELVKFLKICFLIEKYHWIAMDDDKSKALSAAKASKISLVTFLHEYLSKESIEKLDSVFEGNLLAYEGWGFFYPTLCPDPLHSGAKHTRILHRAVLKMLKVNPADYS